MLMKGSKAEKMGYHFNAIPKTLRYQLESSEQHSSLGNVLSTALHTMSTVYGQNYLHADLVTFAEVWIATGLDKLPLLW